MSYTRTPKPGNFHVMRQLKHAPPSNILKTKSDKVKFFYGFSYFHVYIRTHSRRNVEYKMLEVPFVDIKTEIFSFHRCSYTNFKYTFNQYYILLLCLVLLFWVCMCVCLFEKKNFMILRVV